MTLNGSTRLSYSTSLGVHSVTACKKFATSKNNQIIYLIQSYDSNVAILKASILRCVCFLGLDGTI